ncbi:homoserine kinase [Brachybacterium sp. MASK1Z-5]|uniref:Homoserine kinase n=1 Tax=Brachybacterium halotolerans TaxID=2795215 RepID=A0ABS1B710_9MICO|nr:homoserine kinase [Brachybacterium halotolerans]MBK0330375.1 homoserine kinase [Brachybacterium halotolerans]
MRITTERVGVRVPATSANLGPGFDALGLALHLVDDLELEATTGRVEVTVEGEGAGDVPAGEDHLVVRALRRGLDHAGAPQAGVRLHCRNRIPHGRGLGSSAAATVAGLMLARLLVSEPEALDDQVLLDLATEMEGHPDNAAPALLGGVVLSWTDRAGARAERLDLATPGDRAQRGNGAGQSGSGTAQEPAIRPVVLLPTARLATSTARSLLPETVPHADAAFNAARAALLVHALTSDPSLLLPATEDRLHQEYRAPGMPQSVELVRVLRSEGYPAVISGAGPSVLVIDGAGPDLAPLVRRVVDDPRAWRIARVGLSSTGAEPVVP